MVCITDWLSRPPDRSLARRRKCVFNFGRYKISMMMMLLLSPREIQCIVILSFSLLRDNKRQAGMLFFLSFFLSFFRVEEEEEVGKEEKERKKESEKEGLMLQKAIEEGGSGCQRRGSLDTH